MKIPDNFTKSEFLSFLYAERERESAILQTDGRNLWVLMGSLVTVLLYSYSLIKEYFSHIEWNCSCLFVSLGFLFIISYIHLFIKPSNTRLFTRERIRTVQEEAPTTSIYLQLLLCIIMCIWLYMNKLSCVLYYCWFALSILKLLTLIYIAIFKTKFVVAELRMYPFREKWLNTLAAIINNWIILEIAYFTFKYFYKDIINTCTFETFEISICIIFAVILIFFLINTKTNTRKGIEEIDKTIDLYTFNKIDENSAYEQIISLRYGQTAINAFKKEIRDWISTIKKLNAQKDQIMQVTNNMTINVSNYDSDHKLIIQSLIACEKAIKQQKVILGKIQELTNLPNNIFLQEDIKQLLDIVEDGTSLIDNIIEIQDNIVKAYNQHITQYICTKCGGLCENFDCKLRHKKPHFKLIVKQRYWWLIRSLKLLLFRIKVNLKKD